MLERFAQDEKDSFRGAAIRGLGRLGDDAAEPVLLRLLEDARNDDELQLDCAEALLRLKSRLGREKLSGLKLKSAAAQAELSDLLSEPP